MEDLAIARSFLKKIQINGKRVKIYPTDMICTEIIKDEKRK